MFKNKYLKYKNKYLELKKQIAGSDKKVMVPVPGSVSTIKRLDGPCQGPGNTMFDDCNCAFCRERPCRECTYDGNKELCDRCMDKCYCTDTFRCPLCIYQEEFEIKKKEKEIEEEVNDIYDIRSIELENKLTNPKK
jgi:hypothetical protein